MQYLFNTKNKIHFDLVNIHHHFIEPRVLETSQMNRIRLKERHCLQRILRKDLIEEKKSLTHFIRKKNDMRFEEDRKNKIQLFLFFDATFFFPRDGVRVNSKEFPNNAREQIDRNCWRKCWNLIGKDKNIPSVMKKGVKGIRISCSGRLEVAEISKTECEKYEKTSCNVLDQKIDYTSAEVSTRYGTLGVKVWISYSQK
ncbi:hypothetical protein Cgig2_028255 [Carnegiea gigantea]|uniref:Small ribosomal subunit protein uS3 C-terminal domain-containing protein n=1 Tax=Carnegiea gigantea TaxID=171969 RepID=A0A9Q1GMQ7_9CARY|nr:hypothetical protein Cgig2_028255 [Carnegiea gigantea]